jgi:hypothetical protein
MCPSRRPPTASWPIRSVTNTSRPALATGAPAPLPNALDWVPAGCRALAPAPPRHMARKAAGGRAGRVGRQRKRTMRNARPSVALAAARPPGRANPGAHPRLRTCGKSARVRRRICWRRDTGWALVRAHPELTGRAPHRRESWKVAANGAAEGARKTRRPSRHAR